MAKHIVDPDNITGAHKTWSPLEEILIWLDEQIDDARKAQISGFRLTSLSGERAHARHCALYEVRQKLRATMRPDATKMIAKIGRNWSSGVDEQFGGRFVCIHGLADDEAKEIIEAGRKAYSVTRPQSGGGQ